MERFQMGVIMSWSRCTTWPASSSHIACSTPRSTTYYACCENSLSDLDQVIDIPTYTYNSAPVLFHFLPSFPSPHLSSCFFLSHSCCSSLLSLHLTFVLFLSDTLSSPFLPSFIFDSRMLRRSFSTSGRNDPSVNYRRNCCRDIALR